MIFMFFVVGKVLYAQTYNDIHVHPANSEVDVKIFEKDYNVHKVGKTEAKNKIPPYELREYLFIKVKLSEHIQDWDELDKDRLFLRAKEYQVERMQKLYPKIPEDKLKKLKSEIRRHLVK